MEKSSKSCTFNALPQVRGLRHSLASPEDGVVGSGVRSPASSDDHNPKTVVCPPSINEKALIRKIDLRVVPILFIIYVAAFLDRVNISNALTLGLPKDLNLKGNQANVALTIFFVPYVLFEIPSNVLMKRFKPHVWRKRQEAPSMDSS